MTEREQAVCHAIDTWPDGKLDTASLHWRNERRAAGEVLPKPTQKQRRIAELEAALGQYADPRNWECSRCHGKDHINCGMLRWVGPVGDEDGHGYAVARAVLDTGAKAEGV